MEAKEKQRYIIAYLIILLISFVGGAHFGIVTHEIVYNITCFDGSVEWFNESTIEVCGQENPLTYEVKDTWQDVNHWESFNLT